MMLLVISAILASLALGVVIAYALCSTLFSLFRMKIPAAAAPALQMQPDPLQL